jgi:hypothetical protein
MVCCLFLVGLALRQLVFKSQHEEIQRGEHFAKFTSDEVPEEQFQAHLSYELSQKGYSGQTLKGYLQKAIQARRHRLQSKHIYCDTTMSRDKCIDEMRPVFASSPVSSIQELKTFKNLLTSTTPLQIIPHDLPGTIYFHHHRKAGGTSVVELLQMVTHALAYSSDEPSNIPSLVSVEGAPFYYPLLSHSLKFPSKITAFNSGEREAGRSWLFLTTMRHPMERLLSFCVYEGFCEMENDCDLKACDRKASLVCELCCRNKLCWLL